jgi:hypothetical protein
MVHPPLKDRQTTASAPQFLLQQIAERFGKPTPGSPRMRSVPSGAR